MDYVVVDIETTGLSKYYHKITEVAAVKVSEGKIIDEFQTLIDPKVPIPKFITRLTGIDDDLVKGHPIVERILPIFHEFLGDGFFVAHNATFDWGFLDLVSQDHLGTGIRNERLCTRKLANRLLPDLRSKKLGNICDHLDIINTQAHRAMADVMATKDIFESFLFMLKKRGIVEPGDVRKFEKSSMSRILNHNMPDMLRTRKGSKNSSRSP